MDGERSAAGPLVVFASRPNSHPFQERQVRCEEPVKIGRSVARVHPAPSNAIFDCKVLSRNHALLWFEEAKFFLQDTKSSNGTFVNNQRLSKGSEESEPHEIFSGDIIQFGVDVMENSKRVTHGCIMASITLYLPDGSEGKPRFVSSSLSNAHSISTVHSQEMYQLSQFLQEALHREQILQDKLTHLQSLLHSTNESCESSWQALIKEDRLLSKLEVLQNQLSVYSKNQTEGSLQLQIISMEEERLRYEQSSKESLRKVLEEKIAAIQDLAEVERSLANTENECQYLKDLHEKIQQQYADLTEQFEAKMKEHSELEQQLQEAEAKREADYTEYEAIKDGIQAKLEAALADRDAYQAKVIHLQNMQSQSSKSEPSANGGGDDSPINGEMLEEERDACHPPSPDPVDSIESLRLQVQDSQIKIQDYQNLLNKAKQSLAERDDEVKQLNQNMEQAQLEIVEYVTKVATLEEKLKLVSEHNGGRVDETTKLLQEQITQLTLSHNTVVEDLKAELEAMRRAEERSTGGDMQDHAVGAHTKSDDKTDGLNSGLEEITKREITKREITKGETTEVETNEGENTEGVKELSNSQKAEAADLREQIQQLKDQLSNQQTLNQQRNAETCSLQDDLSEARLQAQIQTDTALEYKEQLKSLEAKLQELSDIHRAYIIKAEGDSAALKEEALSNKENCETLQEECSTLRFRVQTIEEELLKLQEDNGKLGIEVTRTKADNVQLTEEITELRKTFTELEELKESLESRESSMKGNLTDVEKERRSLQEQLESERAERDDLFRKYKESVEELRLSREEVDNTKALHSTTQQQLDKLRGELAEETERCSKLASRSNSMTMTSPLPVAVMVLVVVIALYPFLSRVSSSSIS